MNKISEPEHVRVYLIHGLPDPLSRASSHLQIIDRYIADTDIRLRRVRDPNSGAVNVLLQKRSAATSGSAPIRRLDEIHLSGNEYAIFDRFIGYELRKNRYFHEFDRKLLLFDIYLGELSGLAIVRAEFADQGEMENFQPPPFAVLEVTNDPFFEGRSLASKTFPAIKAEVERLGHQWPLETEDQNE